MNTGEFDLSYAEPFDDPLEPWESEETRARRERWRPEEQQARALRRVRIESSRPGSPDQLSRLVEIALQVIARSARERELQQQVRQLRAELQSLRITLERAGINVQPRVPDQPDVLSVATKVAQVAAVHAFGRQAEVELEQAADTPSEAGQHLVRVVVELDETLSPEAYAERRAQFFDLIGEELPPRLSGLLRFRLIVRP